MAPENNNTQDTKTVLNFNMLFPFYNDLTLIADKKTNPFEISS
jgi:hypothetical protein